jgi:hypothetical protein
MRNKYVEVICAHCGKAVQKLTKEYNRSIKKGRKFYCNGSCAAFDKPALVANFGRGDLQWTKENYPVHERDEFAPFRYFTNKARSRIMKKEKKRALGETNLTVEYLKELWEKQNGICPYTGYRMELPEKTEGFYHSGGPTRASLDRIDSSQGYMIGNVEFVCLSVNLAKKSFSREQMLDFFGKTNSVSSS